MKTVFADTLFWIAVTNPHDPWHEKAKKASSVLGPALLVTTDEVLSEFLAAMRKVPELREAAVEVVRKILNNPNIRVVPQSRDSFLRAMRRYSERRDKEYSLTDCASMNVMDEQNIKDVLTNDHEFEQEGYSVLIKA